MHFWHNLSHFRTIKKKICFSLEWYEWGGDLVVLDFPIKFPETKRWYCDAYCSVFKKKVNLMQRPNEVRLLIVIWIKMPETGWI